MIYTVTAADGSTAQYTVKIDFEYIPALTSFSIDGTSGAINQQDKTISVTSTLWVKPASGGGFGSPTVSHDGVFISYPYEVYKYDPLAGNLLWRFWEGHGGGGLTSAYANGYIYVRDWVHIGFGKGYLTFDAENGEIVDESLVSALPHAMIPALTETTQFSVIEGTLKAVDLNSHGPIWSFTGDGRLVSAPIVINNNVIVGSSSGLIYALDTFSGEQIWSANSGAAIVDPYYNEIGNKSLTGFGAGEGYLVVPASNVLTAWRLEPGLPSIPLPAFTSGAPSENRFPSSVWDRVGPAYPRLYKRLSR